MRFLAMETHKKKHDMIFIEVWDIRIKNDAANRKHGLETISFT